MIIIKIASCKPGINKPNTVIGLAFGKNDLMAFIKLLF